MTAPDPIILGWREWAELPALSLAPLAAKLDTGARSCALHARVLETFERQGAPWIRFLALPGAKQGERLLEAPVADRRGIRSSNGEQQFRYLIRTSLRLGEREAQVELSLARRHRLRHPLLIGRTALQALGVYVDAGHEHRLAPPADPASDR